MAEHYCIGIQVRAGPSELIETLRSVRLDTGFAVDVVLLPGRPDEPTTEVPRGDSRELCAFAGEVLPGWYDGWVIMERDGGRMLGEPLENTDGTRFK